MHFAPRFLKALLPVLAFFAALWWTEHWALVFLGLSAFAVAVIIHEKNWQIAAFRTLAAVLPWSIKVDLDAVSMMLPGEWGIAVLAMAVVLFIVREQSWPKGWKNWLPIVWILSFVLPVVPFLVLSVRY